MSFLTPVWSYLDALVHPTAQQDALTAARHRAFIAPRLLGSLAALASFPVYLAFRGVPSALEVGVFAWLAAPILIAYFLSRTGRYESAHVLSAFALTGLVATVAWRTGGIASFAAIWLVIVPLEAALSASRRVVAVASTFALAAAGLLSAKLGGAPVNPYEMSESFKPETPSGGDGVYRRSLYTNWRRTGPPPAMIAFDAPQALGRSVQVKRAHPESAFDPLAHLARTQLAAGRDDARRYP